jgi:hypothetical protein
MDGVVDCLDVGVRPERAASGATQFVPQGSPYVDRDRRMTSIPAGQGDWLRPVELVACLPGFSPGRRTVAASGVCGWAWSSRAA